MAKRPSNSRSNRDRRDDTFARWVIGEAERRRRATQTLCQMCHEPALNPLWAANGRYAFCCDQHRDDYYKTLEEL